jgi:hypothetical protein
MLLDEAHSYWKAEGRANIQSNTEQFHNSSKPHHLIDCILNGGLSSGELCSGSSVSFSRLCGVFFIFQRNLPMCDRKPLILGRHILP